MRLIRSARSISTRLALGFLLTIMAIVFIAGLAIQGFSDLSQGIRLIQRDVLRDAAILEDIRLLLSDAVQQDHAYILSGGADRYDDAFDADTEEIRRLLDRFAAGRRETGLTAFQKRALPQLRAATDELTAVHKTVRELLLAGKASEARQLSEGEGRVAARKVLDVVRRLVREGRAEVDREVAAATSRSAMARRIILVLGLLIAVVGAVVVGSVIRSVTVPVKRLVAVTRRVNRGNLSVRTGMRGDDEIGELAQSFDRMIDRLQAAFAEQERFLVDASHELRTPITIIRGQLEVWQRGARTAEQTERTLGIVLDELDRMARLVNDLLLLARASRTDFLARRPLHLRPFLEEVLEKAEAMAPRAWRLGPAPDLMLVADRDRLTQALLNLLRNAAEHTQPDDLIDLSGRAVDGWVEIAVRDAGTGIPAEVLPEIFQRFRRGPDEQRPGWGLGLSIVEAIVRAHGGQVTVESPAGGGTTFSLRFPAGTPWDEGRAGDEGRAEGDVEKAGVRA